MRSSPTTRTASGSLRSVACCLSTASRSPRAPFTRGAVRAPSKRSLWDATITEVLAGYYEPDEHGRRKPEALYGSLKMWAHLQREGIPVARSTVERLMRRHGRQGVRRQRSVRTTTSDPAAEAEPQYYSEHVTGQPAGSQNPEGA